MPLSPLESSGHGFLVVLRNLKLLGRGVSRCMTMAQAARLAMANVTHSHVHATARLIACC